MTIDDAVNKTVMLIIFTSDGLEAAGIKEKKFYAKLVGRDSIGLWIENPKLETTRVRDDHGAGNAEAPESGLEALHERHAARRGGDQHIERCHVVLGTATSAGENPSPAATSRVSVTPISV